jgi:hypothetical protein
MVGKIYGNSCSEKAEPVARANADSCHDLCLRRARASCRRGSSLTFGKENMSFTFPVIAEVSDKMLSWPALIIWVIVLVGLTWVLGRRKKWLLLIPLPVAWLFASGPFDEMRDPNFGPAVVAELGYSYWAVSIIPIVAVSVVACLPKKPNQPPQPTPVNRRG